MYSIHKFNTTSYPFSRNHFLCRPTFTLYITSRHFILHYFPLSTLSYLPLMAPSFLSIYPSFYVSNFSFYASSFTPNFTKSFCFPYIKSFILLLYPISFIANCHLQLFVRLTVFFIFSNKQKYILDNPSLHDQHDQHTLYFISNICNSPSHSFAIQRVIF